VKTLSVYSQSIGSNSSAMILSS